jgi:branched-chain amino acid transport system permease protein
MASVFGLIWKPFALLFQGIGKVINLIVAPIAKGVAKAPARYREYVMPTVVVVFALVVIPLIFNNLWVSIFTRVAIFTMVAVGANILYGRVGLASLCQIGLMAVGSWVTLRLDFGTSLPLPVIWILGALATMVLGVLVGLPALRLGGLQLAMITLMFAGGLSVVLNKIQFPNGGPGFRGVRKDGGNEGIGRPAGFEGTTAWFRLTVVLTVIALLIALWHLKNRPGRAWAAIRQSEPAALAAGIDITRYKIWAFALSSLLTGFAGGVYASFVSTPGAGQFQIADNITLFAVVLIGAVVIGGKFSLWGALVAGVLKELLPEFFNSHLQRFMEEPRKIGLILFGLGVLGNLIGTTRAAAKKGLSL